MEALPAFSDFRNHESWKGSGDEMEWRLGNKEISKIVAAATSRESRPTHAEMAGRDQAETLSPPGNRSPVNFPVRDQDI